MAQIWLYSLISVLIVSVISLVGVLSIALKAKYVKGFLLFMVSFAAGALLGDVFIHLLPHLVRECGFSGFTSLSILMGMLTFFILEKFLHWHHCHLESPEEHTHPLAFMNLAGDAIHNFIDGALIAGSYLLSIPIGIATTIAVILHEIPQEMGDFGVLLHTGMKVQRALILNFLSALVSIGGVALVLGLGLESEYVVHVVIPFTIGGFLYIAMTDLIPELHKEIRPMNTIIQLLSLTLGVGVMTLLLLTE